MKFRLWRRSRAGADQSRTLAASLPPLDAAQIRQQTATSASEAAYQRHNAVIVPRPASPPWVFSSSASGGFLASPTTYSSSGDSGGCSSPDSGSSGGCDAGGF